MHKKPEKNCFVIFFGVEVCAVDHPRTTIIKEEEEEEKGADMIKMDWGFTTAA